ncbi:MAG: FtsX-like permease family protein [Chthoniobacterales bacterium]|nr:FtsX-like permease family protein [Chthoniobacterales bacterium]
MSAVLLILRRCALRHWRLALRQQVALVLILALGSSVYLAVRLASNAALSGFETFTQGITRQPDWTVQSVGGVLREDDVRRMREVLGERPVDLLPVVEETVSPASDDGNGEIGSRPTWRLLGVDFFALLNLQDEAPTGFGGSLRELRSGVYVSPKLGAQEGDELRLIVDDRVIKVKVAGVVPETPGVPALPKHLLLMDLPEARSLLMRDDQVDRVEVLAKDSDLFPHLRAETGNLLKSSWLVTDGASRRHLAGTMTQAFRLNLTILSLLALLVGGYLIFQALDGVVLRRREEIGILKSLGVTDGAIQLAFLIEAGLLGLLGGALGTLLGWIGAQGAVGGVTRTMNALYGATSEQRAALGAEEALVAISIAISASLAAAWWPSRMAARTPPAQMLGHHAVLFEGGAVWRAEWVGWTMMLAAVLLAQLPALRFASGTRLPLAGYASALLWLIGSGLAAGSVLRFLGQAKMPSAPWRIALSYIRRPTVRHRFAVAALTSAAAMTTGMTVMVGSFDHTMRDWIDRTMRADIYISSAGAQSASSTHSISPTTVAELARDPEVAELAIVQAKTLPWNGSEVVILGTDPLFAHRHGLLAWVQPPARDEWWRKNNGIAPAIVSESWSERFGTKAGDVIELAGRKAQVGAINAEYGNERGSLTLPQEVFREWFNTDEAWRLALMLKTGADAETVRARIQERQPGLSIFTNAHLRSEALRIFRQTFAVTHALEVIGVIVAVAGLGLTLASLLLERRAVLATLRSLGMRQGEIARSAALEGLVVAGAGTFTGIAAGLWLGWLLVHRINKQCFGWTLQFHTMWWNLALLGVAVIAAGTLVAAAVGRWAAMLPPEHTEE